MKITEPKSSFTVLQIWLLFYLTSTDQDYRDVMTPSLRAVLNRHYNAVQLYLGKTVNDLPKTETSTKDCYCAVCQPTRKLELSSREHLILSGCPACSGEYNTNTVMTQIAQWIYGDD